MDKNNIMIMDITDKQQMQMGVTHTKNNTGQNAAE